MGEVKSNIIRHIRGAVQTGPLQPIRRSHRLNEVILFDSKVRSDLLFGFGGTGIYR